MLFFSQFFSSSDLDKYAWTKPRNDEGAALITALIIVSVMAVTALAVIESLRFSMRLSGNMSQREQARLYALGAEELAAATIKTARSLENREQNKRFPALDEWTKKPLFFPIDGGFIKGRVRDGSNCFNINAVVRLDENKAIIADEAEIGRFAYMLEYIGIPPSEAKSLAMSVADWIDEDSSPNFGGAEDPDYAVRQPAYRTGRTFLADVSELKVIKGFTPELVERLGMWVCARPSMQLNQLNINTLTADDIPVFLSYLGPSFNETGVNMILGERPVNGFQSVEEMLALSVFEGDKLPTDDVLLFGLTTEYFDLKAQITYYQSVINLHSILQISPNGDITKISRSYGTF